MPHVSIRPRPFLSIAFASLLVTGCATIIPRDETALSPIGQTLQVVAANGATSRMTFRPNGIVTATFNNRSIDGRWEMSGNDLCFNWGAAPRECWPLQGRLVRGRTQTFTSSRGNIVRVTRL